MAAHLDKENSNFSSNLGTELGIIVLAKNWVAISSLLPISMIFLSIKQNPLKSYK
jgi:hypothetical protein